MTVPIFTISDYFAATREAVWDAWTQPDLLAQWFGPKGTDVEVIQCDVRPGGTVLSKFLFGGEPSMWGKFVYREVVPPSRLVWVHSFADADARIVRHPYNPKWPLEMLATVNFDMALAEQTEVTLSWKPLHARPDEEAAFAGGMDSMKTGWGGSFERLTDLLKKK